METENVKFVDIDKQVSNEILEEELFEEFNMDKEKLKLVQTLMPEPLKTSTEITKDERVLLSSAYLLVRPFEKLKDFEIYHLKAYLDHYLLFGISVKRKGRKEIVEILKSLFGGKSQEEMEEKSLREMLLG